MRIDEIVCELKWLQNYTNRIDTLNALDEACKYLENMPLTDEMSANYISENGYTGKLYGKSSYAVFDATGLLRFHTGFRTINTIAELKKQVDEFPEFLKIFKEGE